MSLSAKRESLARLYGSYQRAGRPHKTRTVAHCDDHLCPVKRKPIAYFYFIQSSWARGECPKVESAAASAGGDQRRPDGDEPADLQRHDQRAGLGRGEFRSDPDPGSNESGAGAGDGTGRGDGADLHGERDGVAEPDQSGADEQREQRDGDVALACGSPSLPAAGADEQPEPGREPQSE